MGWYFIAANRGSMRNYGHKHVKGDTEDGQTVNITMQVTDVNKVFVSVGHICEAGHFVIFRKDGGAILSPDKRKIGCTLENGVYNMNI